MQQLNNIFKGVAEVALPSHSFLFERWSNAAEKIHSQSLPAVIHIIPQSVALELNTMQTRAKNTTTCLLAFFRLCPSLDASGEEMAEVIDMCKADAMLFLSELIRRDRIEVQNNIRLQVTEAGYSACLAGVVMELQVLTPSESLCSLASE